MLRIDAMAVVLTVSTGAVAGDPVYSRLVQRIGMNRTIANDRLGSLASVRRHHGQVRSTFQLLPKCCTATIAELGPQATLGLGIIRSARRRAGHQVPSPVPRPQ
jgi:hypothetical protein